MAVFCFDHHVVNVYFYLVTAVHIQGTLPDLRVSVADTFQSEPLNQVFRSIDIHVGRLFRGNPVLIHPPVATVLTKDHWVPGRSPPKHGGTLGSGAQE